MARLPVPSISIQMGRAKKRSTSKSKAKSAGGATKFLAYAGVPLMAIGLVLILGSFAVKTIPNKVVWSDEQAQSHQAASNKYHQDQFDKSLSKRELQASREAFEEIDVKLQRAKDAKSGLPKLLRWGGVIFAAIGFVSQLLAQSFES